MGAWLSVLPCAVHGTELGAQEWRDSLFLRYGINTSDLPKHFYGCGVAFDIYHALDCNKGGLIAQHHNNICDGFADLAKKSFTPTYVRDYPKIYTRCAVRGGNKNMKWSPSQDEGELKGGTLVRDIWTQGMDSIHDMRTMNTDATSYLSRHI